jgi:hypothetical protein
MNNFPRSTSAGPTACLGHGDAANALKAAEPERWFRRQRSAERNFDKLGSLGEPLRN